MIEANVELQTQTQATICSELPQKILDATVDLFAEMGYSKVCTNRIAERAGISVGSIYRFFPNKFAIFDAVQKRFHGALESTIQHYIQYADRAAPWSVHVNYLGDALAELWQKNAALIDAWTVLAGNPEMTEADRHHRDKMANLLASYLVQAAPARSLDECYCAALAIHETAIGLLDMTVEEPADDGHRMVNEMKRMITNHIASFVTLNS